MNRHRRSSASNSPPRLALALVALAAAPACATDPAASDATSPLADGAAGADGEGGGGMDSGGDAALPMCRAREGRILIDTDPATGTPCGGCDPGFDASGVISSASPGRFVLDRCPPGAACAEIPLQFEVIATGYEQTLPVGALVELRYRERSMGIAGTSYTLSVRNLPEWEGVTNPVATSDFWHLVLSEGMGPPAEAPFSVTLRRLDCAGVLGGGAREEYRLVFGGPDGGATLELGQGESGTVELAGQEWGITVLRSSVSSNTDQPPPDAWWALGGPP